MVFYFKLCFQDIFALITGILFVITCFETAILQVYILLHHDIFTSVIFQHFPRKSRTLREWSDAVVCLCKNMISCLMSMTKVKQLVDKLTFLVSVQITLKFHINVSSNYIESHIKKGKFCSLSDQQWFFSCSLKLRVVFPDICVMLFVCYVNWCTLCFVVHQIKSL